ncbi:MAG: efflux transporter outer membrane subunit [Thermodesulfobacteriota bacterium]
MKQQTTAALLLFFCCALLFLGPGCTVGPDYRRPQVAAPESWERQEGVSAAPIADVWWEGFGDPKLNDLVGQALAGNQDLLAAQARIEEYKAVLTQAKAGYYPQVSASLSAARERASENGTTAIPKGFSPIADLFQAAGQASWDLDVFGKTRRQVEAARANLAASEEGKLATQLELVGSVVSGYISLAALDRKLLIAKKTAETRKETLRLFTLRRQGGLISEQDLLQARSQYQDAVAQIPGLESSIANQENALCVLLGKNPGPVPRGLPIEKLAAPDVPAGLPSGLLSRRPDLRRAEQNLVAKNADIGAAKAQYFPSLSLTGGFGFASTELSNLFVGPSRTWSYAAGLTQPVFMGGAISGVVAQAEAAYTQTLFSYRKAVIQAFSEVEDALAARKWSAEELAIQAEQMQTLREYARMARLRYDNGVTSYLEVLDADRALFSVELSAVEAKSSSLTSLVNLYQALGGGWEFSPAARADGQENAPPQPKEMQ